MDCEINAFVSKFNLTMTNSSIVEELLTHNCRNHHAPNATQLDPYNLQTMNVFHHKVLDFLICEANINLAQERWKCEY